MRLNRFLLSAAIFAASPAVAVAQTILDGNSTDAFVLRGTQAPEDAPATATIAADAPAGPVVRQQPLASAEPLDDTTTGSVPRRAPAPAADPYAALGVRAGGFIVCPSVTVSAGYTSNAAGAAGGTGSGTATVSPEIAIRSDWAENEANLTIRGSYEKFLDGVTAGKPTAAVDGNVRIDGQDGWSTAFAAGYAFKTQSISDPNFPAGVDRPPGVHDLTSSLAFDRNTGPAVVQVEGSVDRTIYENGTSGGVVVPQGYRTNTLYGGRVRLGYETGASVAPFVEAELKRRTYDQTLDNNGLMRSGTVQAYRAGVMIDRAPVLSGEVAVGYLRATFDDPVLAALATMVIDGSLVWSPSELTSLTLNAATSISPSTDPASSGSLVHDASIVFAYDWRQDVTFNGTASLRHEQYQGTGQVDTDYKAGLAATWKANRWFYLTGRYEHEWLTSTLAGRGYQSDAVKVELRAQR
jgi:hypothetical protein